MLAAWPDSAGLVECLEALAPQREGATDVVVVTPAPVADLGARFPWISCVSASPDLLIPHLWSLGIAAARREVVALTTAHFTPAPDWVSVIRACHARLPSAGIGGKVEPPRGGGLVAWATYFLRYSPYLGYDREQAVADLAGDNAAYKRAVLNAHPECLRDGFWEQEFHKSVRSEGQSLTFIPGMRVRLRTSFGFAPFIRQRLRHGREFGRRRLEGRAPAWRVAAVAASPLIPAVLLGKIALRVLRSRRDWRPFLAALPILCAFVLAWALGEASGYLAPRPGRRATAAPAA